MRMNNSPLHNIDATFKTSSKGQQTPRDCWGEVDVIKKLYLENNENKRQYFRDLNIIKNWADIDEGMIARYRCMVQQPLSPEWYAGAYKIINEENCDDEWQTSKYRDRIGDCIINEEKVILWRRFPFKCIRIPHQTRWASILEECENPLDEYFQETTFHEYDEASNVCDSDCLVKVYDDECEMLEEKTNNHMAICVNDLVEFVGLFYGGIVEDKEKHNNIFSNLPSLHVLYYRKLGNWNPLFDMCLSKVDNFLDIIFSLGPYKSAAELRSALVDWIADSVFGDRCTAEYLVLSLCSSQFNGLIKKIGRFSLNLYNIPNDVKNSCSQATEQIGQLIMKLKLLLPRVAEMMMSQDLLNTTSIFSTMEYFADYDILHRGFLQLGAGTCVIIDEREGSKNLELNSLGKENISAIHNLLSTGQLGYRYLPYFVHYDVDFPVIILSKSASQFFSSIDVTIPLEALSSSKSEKFELTDHALKQFQLWIAYVSSLTIPLNTPEEVTEFLTNYFVEERQKNMIPSDILLMWLKLARIYCFSFDLKTLTVDKWAELMEIERVRIQRNKKFIIPNEA